MDRPYLYVARSDNEWAIVTPTAVATIGLPRTFGNFVCPIGSPPTGLFALVAPLLP